MLFSAHRIPYQQTNHFSRIVVDYLAQEPSLQSFFSFAPTLQGLQQAVEQKKNHKINRTALTEVLQRQYSSVSPTAEVRKNIHLLTSENTFTITTAHQPNLFTGPLYFIYKILHAIKLSATLKEALPQYDFVPVYYMGSEDADLAELNHTYLRGQKYEWDTNQTGAVGRMVADKKIQQLLAAMEGQLTAEPFGAEVIFLLKQCYSEGKSIQQATFEFVHLLFGQYGLIVLIPDTAILKQQMVSVFEDDLFHQTPSQIVEQTSQKLSKLFNVQASPREINLFYLKDNLRERIIKAGESFAVNNTNIQFTQEQIKAELQEHPERFSPNVILRGLFQETLLPNIAFIGGGGELAYWLQLKELFDHYTVPFPVLVLRNSFLIIEKKWQELIAKLKLSMEQVFQPEQAILDAIMEREGKKPVMNGELQELKTLYDHLKTVASEIDQSLTQHVEALKIKATNQLMALEKKMIRAERKKLDAQRNQINKLKRGLFPNGLQERSENMSVFYAKWGTEFITSLYQHSLSLEQEFVMLSE